jgi:integrase
MTPPRAVQSLADRLRRAGKSMSREKHQRPEVKAWTGKSGEKYWKGEWRLYLAGRKPKHRAQTWPCAKYTKTAAQKALDAIVREETGGEAKADGSMTVADFWARVFWPTCSHRVTVSTAKAYASCLRNHIAPAIGPLELRHVSKSAISGLLDKMADKRVSKPLIERALFLCNRLFEEAVDNDYVPKNPARGVTLPNTKPNGETRPLTEAECRKLLDATTGRDRLMWSVLLRTGIRIGELLALQVCDILPGGLRIDESGYGGHASTTKNKKTRIVPMSAALRSELEAWTAGRDADALIFPNRDGRMFARESSTIKGILAAARKVIPDLRYRMTRTTFATLFGGDPSDAQAILGHASVDLTMRVYRKAQAGRQMDALEDWDARLSGKVVTMPRKKESA